MAHQIPEKTIERLSQYRRILLGLDLLRKQYIFSHELARLLHITPVQVRRDLMLIGYTGTLRKGYDIGELIDSISNIIDPEDQVNVALVGAGNLGRAVTGYFNGKRSRIKIVAVFDIDPAKINRLVSGVKCYAVDELEAVIKSEGITIGIIATPPEITAGVAERMVIAGIRGILNYTPCPLNVPSRVFLEEYDMVTSLEKVVYYAHQD